MKQRNKQLLVLLSFLLVTACTHEVTRNTSSIPKKLSHKFFSLKKQKPSFKNWGLENSLSNSHIHAPEAWKITKGNSSVVVAVIDTGIDFSHPDLKANQWKDKKGNYGFDFVTKKPNPKDEHGHGTHVAGIIGATTNLKAGISGVAPKVSLMAVRYYSPANSGTVNLKNTVKAIDYAIEHNAQIINYSGGGPEFSEPEYLALKRAEAKGILVIAAAGNEKQNTDQMENYYYPAAYRLKNIISVAAITETNNLLSSSNWGKTRVDVAAPGENIYSTLPGSNYGKMSGTSQATAFVTGVAALILSQNPSLKPEQIRDIIVHSVDKSSILKEKVLSGGKVNAYAALKSLNEKPDFKIATRTLPSPTIKKHTQNRSSAWLEEKPFKPTTSIQFQ